MAYEHEELCGGGPTWLIDEHRLLVQWLAANPRYGRADGLNARLVDGDQGLALYYINGFGMGEGMSFALLRGRQIYVFDATRAGACNASIGRVSIPEGSNLSRQAIQMLVQTAFASYASLVGFSYLQPGDWSASFERTHWEVRPRKYSVLYFKRLARAWHEKQQPSLRRIADFLKSPLVALLLVAGTLRWQADPALVRVQHLPSLFAAVWFISRLLTFDTDYRFWPWLAGISKLRNPAQVFATLGRLREPRPLKALSATVDLSRLGSASAHITITNRSRWPVGHLKLQRMALAGLLAPQSLAAVRAGQLDRKAFNERFPDLQRRWLWPSQSAIWAVSVEPTDVPSELPRQLEVLLRIPRFAASERRSGLNSYLIPVTVIK
jgi:hypothetical protein